MRTSNPALNDTTFQRAAYGTATTDRMTLEGAVLKTGADWHNGSAVYYALSIEGYSTPLGQWLRGALRRQR